MKKLISLISLSSLLMLNLALAGPEKGHRDGAVYDYANVVKVVPVVRQVKISTPTRECWEETVVESVPHRPGVSGSAIVGGLVGGLIGSQFGHGGGQVAMTMLGVAVGSTVGQSASRQGTASAETVSYPVQRCQTREQVSFQERVEGYQVTYKYHGRLYSTRMPYDPGKRVKVRVDVRPSIDDQYR